MNTLGCRIARLIITGAAAAAFVITPSVLIEHDTAVADQAQPCINGVSPGNPYIQNCNLPPRRPQVRGAAPDAGAIIACRNWPGCLSWYVNGP